MNKKLKKVKNAKQRAAIQVERDIEKRRDKNGYCNK